MKTKEQLRAVCPACFREQAVYGICMVQHGYTRPQGWHCNANTCGGVNKPHFGTALGRAVARNINNAIRTYADNQMLRVKQLKSGAITSVTVKDGWGRDSKFKVIHLTDSLWVKYRDQEIHKGESTAHNAMAHVTETQKRIDAWQAKAPRAVQVERKTGPMIHWAGGRWKHGKACAGSAMGAQKGLATLTQDQVNCPKCLALIANKNSIPKK